MLATVGEIRSKMHDQINLAMSDIVKEVNESLSRILQSTIRNAELLEASLDQYILKAKLSSNKSPNDSRDEGYGSIIDSTKNSKSEKMSTKSDLYHNADFGLITDNKPHELGNLVNTYVENTNEYAEPRFYSSLAKTEEDQNCLTNDAENADMGTESKKKLHCPQCDYVSQRERWIKQHIKTVHNKIKDFECSQCNYTSSQKNFLTRHVQTSHK